MDDKTLNKILQIKMELSSNAEKSLLKSSFIDRRQRNKDGLEYQKEEKIPKLSDLEPKMYFESLMVQINNISSKLGEISFEPSTSDNEECEYSAEDKEATSLKFLNEDKVTVRYVFIFCRLC